MIDPLWLSYSSFSAAFLNFLLFQELLVLLQCSGDFLRHILLVVLSQNFCSFKIAHSTPGLLCDPKLVLLQNHLIRLLHFLRERLNKPLHHHGVAFPEKIRQRSLEFDQNSAEPKLGLGGILSVFGDRIAGGHVENELVLELVEHDDNESRDAAEGLRGCSFAFELSGFNGTNAGGRLRHCARYGCKCGCLKSSAAYISKPPSRLVSPLLWWIRIKKWRQSPGTNRGSVFRALP
nr:hypothetical protein TorRG33x02_013630 [Ipomoea batatas]